MNQEEARTLLEHMADDQPAKQAPLASANGSARNAITLKWGTLKGWDIKTDAARAELKKYHEDPVQWSVMMQRDTAKQKEAIMELIDCCDEITLEWDGKQVSRDEAKEYIRTYGQNSGIVQRDDTAKT